MLAVLGVGSIAFGGASLESVLNAGIAAVLFNIIYDTLLGAKLKWHALCPVIDTMNHSSTSKVNTHSAAAHGLVCTQAHMRIQGSRCGGRSASLLPCESVAIHKALEDM